MQNETPIGYYIAAISAMAASIAFLARVVTKRLEHSDHQLQEERKTRDLQLQEERRMRDLQLQEERRTRTEETKAFLSQLAVLAKGHEREMEQFVTRLEQSDRIYKQQTEILKEIKTRKPR